MANVVCSGSLQHAIRWPMVMSEQPLPYHVAATVATVAELEVRYHWSEQSCQQCASH